MSLDFFFRLELVDQLIRTKSTGSPRELAERLNISERALYNYLDLLRVLGAPIGYSKSRRSYYYEENGGFGFRFEKKAG